MKFLTRTGTVALILFFVAGCAPQPIYNVKESMVTSPATNAVTKEQVRAAIIRAGGALGWIIKDEGPDKLSGTLVLRTHTAVVDIPYSPEKYSIVYRSSINLNEKGGKIHKNYNGWIQNLNKGINTQLSLL
jgi:hypothetical protein